mmetsp:Transcript_20141/g.45868  ORF Transcript_20141/g.45868 Transcript_20141/m.45868 type:complete len:437 (+) Transcript_20141:688-1998(+)
MYEERGAVLAVVHRLKLLPGLVRQHRVLEDTCRVDEAYDVGGVGGDPLVNGALRPHVQLALLHVDTHGRGPILNVLPPAHVQVADLHRAGQEMDCKLGIVAPATRCLLLLCQIQDPLSHNKAQGAVAARDADDTLFEQLELDARRLVGVGRHLAHDVAPGRPVVANAVLDWVRVAEADGVDPEGAHAENLGADVGVHHLVIRQLRVDKVNGELQLLSSGVAEAVQRGVGDARQAPLGVPLLVNAEDVVGEHRHPLAAAILLEAGLEEEEQELHQAVLLVDHVRRAAALRRVQPAGDDDHVPLLGPDQRLAVRCIQRADGLCHHLLGADTALGRLLQDPVDNTALIGKDEDVLLLRRVLLGQGARLAVDGLGDRVAHRRVQRGPVLVLQGKVLLEPIDDEGAVAVHVREAGRAVLALDVVIGLLAVVERLLQISEHC